MLLRPLGQPGGALRGRPAAAQRCCAPRVGRILRGRRQVQVRAESLLLDDDPTASRVPTEEPPRRSTVFDEDRWLMHRDTGRYFRHLQGIFKSSTYKALQKPLSVITLFSTFVAMYHELNVSGLYPDVFPEINITDVPFQLTSFALSLLLVFRTDASYGRWCQALDAWEVVRSAAKQIARESVVWFSDINTRDAIVRWTLAYSRSLMVYLRDSGHVREQEAALRQELKEILLPWEVEAVLSTGTAWPQFCIHMLTQIVSCATVSETRQVELMQDLRRLNEPLGRCQRLKRYPIPLSYTRHTSRFMLIYLMFMPLALVDSCDWAVIPVTFLMGFLLLGIEECGVQIEEPFRMLPLKELTEDITYSVRQIVSEGDIVRRLASETLGPAMVVTNSYDGNNGGATNASRASMDGSELTNASGSCSNPAAVRAAMSAIRASRH